MITRVLLALALLAAPSPTPETPPPALAKPVELLAGPVLNGTREDIAKARAGKYLMIDFWSIGCKPCLKAMPLLVKLQKEHAGKLLIVGVHIGRGTPAEVAPVLKKLEVTYPVIVPADYEDPKVDIPGADFMAQYGSEMLPRAAILSPDGTLLHWNLPPDEAHRAMTALLR